MDLSLCLRKESSVDQALYVCVECTYAGVAVCACQCAWMCICMNVHADKHHIIKAYHPYQPEINPLLSDDLLSIQLIFITFSVSFLPPYSSISSSLFLFYQEKQLRLKISILTNAINCLIFNGITALLAEVFKLHFLSYHFPLQNIQALIVITLKNVCLYVHVGMKWGWKHAQRWAAPPVTGHLYSLWRLPLLDKQCHCWTCSLTHTLAYRPPFFSPGPLLLTLMGTFSIMRFTEGWPIPMAATEVMQRHLSTGTSLPLTEMKHSSRTLYTSTRYTLYICMCMFSKIEL